MIHRGVTYYQPRCALWLNEESDTLVQWDITVRKEMHYEEKA